MAAAVVPARGSSGASADAAVCASIGTTAESAEAEAKALAERAGTMAPARRRPTASAARTAVVAAAAAA